MGTFLAAVALAVPLISWLRGTFFFRAPEYGLARTPFAPRGIAPTSWKFQHPRFARADEVRP
ncbi:MAG: hypothetical protein DMG39_24775 [Acidobacteria bacterium]|nr:MAG: hypothetical protein DMG39_24775 [Acidobacteriota bacterium]